MAQTEMSAGDKVVFARLDLAEALGIWRHATGQVVETHVAPGQSATVDVKFDGHDTLQGYLVALFEKRAGEAPH